MAGAVNIKFGAIVSGFVSGMGQASASVAQFSRNLNQNLAAAYASADRQQRVFDRGIGRLASTLQNTGQNLSAYVTLPLAGIGAASIKAAADMEQAGVSFRVLLKDANLAAATINDLKAFAASTPFEFTEVQAGAKQLLAYGFAVGDIKTLLTDAGNLASGFGVSIGEVTRVLGRMKSGDFGEAFERLRDFGIGRDQLEAKGLKFDKSGQYQGSVQQAFTAIQGIIRERFGGQMEEQSRTLGGIFSNIADQANFALADLGASLVQSFNLKEVGRGFADFIGTIRTGFLSMSEPAQGFSLALAGIAAAAGPFSIALGGLIKLLPTLKLGFAALTGPVGLTVAAVAGAAILIASNWDSIKKTLTDTGVWATLTALARDTMQAVGSLITAGTELIRAGWARFGGSIINTIRGAFTAVSGIVSGTLTAVGALFTAGAGTLTGLFKAITGALTGDWSKMGEGLQNITASVWNGILSLFIAGARATGGVLSGFLQTVGADDLANRVKARIDAVAKGAAGLQIALKGVKTEVSAIAKTATPTTPKPTVLGAPGSLSGLSGAANGSAEKIEKTKTVLEEAQERLRELESRIQNFSFRGIAVPDSLLRQYQALKTDVEAAQKALSNFKPVDLGKLSTLAGPTAAQGGQAISQILGQVSVPELPGLAQLQSRIVEGQQAIESRVASFREFMGIGAAQLTEAGIGLFQGLGTALGSGQNPLKSVLQTITGFIGDFAIKLGSAILLMGKLETVAAAIPGLAPLFALTGPAKIAVGGGLIVGGAAIKATAFANGGIVSGPTLGLVGEYAGARNNPEVIAPLDKLKGMIGGARDLNVNGEFRVQGTDLVMVLERTQRGQNVFR